jgi:hypothetical protein
LHANRGGIKLLNGDAHRDDLFIEQRLDGFPADSLAGMATRDSGIDLGLSWRYRQLWGTVQAELMQDVGGILKGNEFRLGMGVSLAQRAPHIEASSQAVSGKPASRMLDYLNPTIDVSLGDLLGSHALKDTFIGFGASRLLGNVNGGSNYRYTCVE